MRALKSGKIGLTTSKVTYGRLAVFCMKWLPYDLHSKLTIWVDYTRK